MDWNEGWNSGWNDGWDGPPFNPIPPVPPFPIVVPQPTLNVFIAGGGGFGSSPLALRGSNDAGDVADDFTALDFVGTSYLPPKKDKEEVRNVVYNFASDIEPDSRTRVLKFLHKAEEKKLWVDRSDTVRVAERKSMFDFEIPEKLNGGTLVRVAPDLRMTDSRVPLAQLAHQMGFRLVTFNEQQLFLLDKKSVKKRLHPGFWIAFGVGIGVLIGRAGKN